jgi:threonine/homoserine/homoserine lactone efflux protein
MYKTVDWALRSVAAMDSIAPLIGLTAFSFVSAVTPGPNNVLLWASGMRFGFRRSLRHVVGTAIGIGGLAVAVAVGLGALLSAASGLTVVMRLAGSIYLAWLAWQIAKSGDVNRAELDRPMGLRAAALFQVANPKAWIFALGAISTFHPPDLPGLAGSLVVAVVMMAVVVPSAAIWAGAGGFIGGLIENPRARRRIDLVLAVLVVATIVTVWL